MEGKTTVLSNLGIVLAETGRRVLLVDADLRRPRLHEVFNICNSWGLSDVLQGSEPVENMVRESLSRRSDIPGLFVLPSGPGAANLMRLLYSKRLHAFLRQLRAEFDTVLIDTPPMSKFSDARVLGHYSDSVIMVVRASKTSRDQIRAGFFRFVDDQTPVLGTILNDWKPGTRMPVYGYNRG
jgi:receptor protein-tyrosine kinase